LRPAARMNDQKIGVMGHDSEQYRSDDTVNADPVFM
jgi:hypothetical protein